MNFDSVSRRPALLRAVWILILGALMAVVALPAAAQGPSGYGLKIFRTSPALYPFVQVYFRTFDREMQPLVNLNELNIGLMVDGKSYDVTKRQYFLQSIANREDAVRAVFVLDTSGSMQGAPFNAALEATARFIDAKREQDQVAVIALSDGGQGYRLVSDFERDPGALARRLADLDANMQESRIYDAIGAAMQLSATAGQGGQMATTPIASTSIIVFSDGKDEGSALSRGDLMGRISDLQIPVPIYGLGYATGDPATLRNLEALASNSFGRMYDVSNQPDRMTQIVEDIHRIKLNDYVLTFRSYVGVDGDRHAVRVGVEYPSRSGQYQFDSASFEAITPPPVEAITRMRQELNQKIPEVQPDPYLEDPLLSSPSEG